MLSFGSRGRRSAALLVLALSLIVLAGCAGAAGVLSPVDGQAPDFAGEQPRPVSGSGDGDGPGANPRGPLYQDVSRPDLLIIKTGALVIQVTGLDDAVRAANQAVVALGGYASGSERSGEDEDAQASVTFRIPAARWDEALATIRGLGEKVLHERSGTEDVTAQVVDLGARIRNLQATEAAFQEIMTRATEITDVLKVQAELTKVRGEIEQLTAQKAHLEEQAAYSTLTVTFSLKPNPVLLSQEQFDPATEVDQATASLVSVLQGLATAGIWFGIVWLPILVVLALVALVVAVVVRRFRRSKGEPVVTPGASA